MQEGSKKTSNQWASSSRGLGWGEDDGGWSVGPPATGSGWTDPSPAANDRGQSIGTWHNPSKDCDWRQSSSVNSIIVDSSDKEAWPSIANSEAAGSDAGDDAASIKSGSVISSSSSHGQNQETNQGLSAMQSQSASNPWGANSTFSGLESSLWGLTEPPNSSAANSNPSSWGSSNPHPSLSMNNQGHNMQTGTSLAGSDNLSNSINSTVPSSTGWGTGAPGQGSPRLPNSMQMQTSNGNNMHGLMLNSSGAQQSGPPVSGNQTGPSNNQTPWQGSSSAIFGMTGLSKPQESGWNNPTSAVMNNSGKDSSGNNGGQEGVNAGSSLWGTADGATKSGFAGGAGWGEPLPTTPQSATQWDNTSKSQWGDNPNGASNSQGSGNNTEITSWAQAACKGLNTGSSNSGSGQPSAADGAATIVKDDLIRRAIENHDGWGAKPVKQDTAWDVQESPKTKRKFSTDSAIGASNVWNNNNGTAIWEASRESCSSGNGGNGGWNGASGGSQWQNEPDSSTWSGPPGKIGADSQWGGTAGATGNNGGSDKTIGTWGGGSGMESSASNMWGTKTETGSWGQPAQDRDRGAQWGESQQGPEPTGWDDPALQRRRNVDNGTGYWGDPQPPPQRVQAPWSSQPSTPATPLTPRAKPEEVWNKGVMPSVQMVPGGGPPGAPPPQQPQPPTKASGWGDPNSAGMKVDDGTSIWAANAQQQARAGGWGDTGSQWNPTPGAKPKSLSTSSWGSDGGGDQSWRKVPNKFPTGTNHPQMRSKLLQQLMDMGFKKEEAQNALISNNMNVESALADLRAINGANKKDADMDVFMPNGAKPRMSGLMPDNAMLNDDISDTQSESNPHVPNINMQNTPFQNAQVPNQPFMTMYDRSKSGPSLPPSSLNPNNPSINPQSLQQKLMHHKRQQQQQQQQQNQSLNSMSPTQGPMNRGQLPSTHLITQQQILQQLRLAVQSGLISPQLLNKELPQNILVLLQQLLNYQNILQQLLTKQQFLQQSRNLGGVQQRQPLEQLVGMISNVKHQILQLQRQLSQAQPFLLKNPGGGSGAGGPMPQTRGAGQQHIAENVEAMIPIQNELEKLAINPTPVPTSRLNQWKRQTPDKETVGELGENLNKAVGSKPLHQSQSAPRLGAFSDLSGLNISGDTTWSTQATTSSQNWPSTSSGGTTSQADSKNSGEVKESLPPVTTSSTPTMSMTDIIPEFVPGKPWQGLTKNVEDDPHITPGTFNRSLSVNVVKDDYLNNLASIKTSPVISGEASWGIKGNNPTTTSSKAWSTSESPEVWSMASKNRPPPGLMAQGKGQWPIGMNRQNSWGGRTDNSAFTPVSTQGWDGRAPNTTSTWLVLRNLTPQIDGSTLRTLCQQHGPLRLFHLNLSHGQAVVCYNSREEAIKAQKSLNTCVLGNTTILAEFVSDQEGAQFVDQHNNMTSNNTSQWSQSPQTSNFQPTNHAPGNSANPRASLPSATQTGQFNRNETTVWSTMPSQTGGSYPSAGIRSMAPPGGNMWSSSLWTGGAVEDHNSNPFLSNILGGESM